MSDDPPFSIPTSYSRQDSTITPSRVRPNRLARFDHVHPPSPPNGLDRLPREGETGVWSPCFKMTTFESGPVPFRTGATEPDWYGIDLDVAISEALTGSPPGEEDQLEESGTGRGRGNGKGLLPQFGMKVVE